LQEEEAAQNQKEKEVESKKKQEVKEEEAVRQQNVGEEEVDKTERTWKRSKAKARNVSKEYERKQAKQEGNIYKRRKLRTCWKKNVRKGKEKCDEVAEQNLEALKYEHLRKQVEIEEEDVWKWETHKEQAKRKQELQMEEPARKQVVQEKLLNECWNHKRR